MKLQNTIVRAASFALVAILAPACHSRPEPAAPATAHLAEQAPAVRSVGTVEFRSCRTRPTAA